MSASLVLPSGYSLEVNAERLELAYTSGRVSSKIFADFINGPVGFRIRQRRGRNQAIARAIGLKKHKDAPMILDATAGLGRDGCILASLGCEVYMVERSPLIGALLLDGLKRAHQRATMAHVIQKMQVTFADAKRVLKTIQTPNLPDVVYLDPMFPSAKKKALNKIQMRIIRGIVGEDMDADQLLFLALEKAKKRVVVKRSSSAPALANLSPSFIVPGKSNRYDVYLVGAFSGYSLCE